MSYQDDPDERAEMEQYRDDCQKTADRLGEEREEQRWWQEYDKRKEAELARAVLERTK